MCACSYHTEAGELYKALRAHRNEHHGPDSDCMCGCSACRPRDQTYPWWRGFRPEKCQLRPLQQPELSEWMIREAPRLPPWGGLHFVASINVNSQQIHSHFGPAAGLQSSSHPDSPTPLGLPIPVKFPLICDCQFSNFTARAVPPLTGGEWYRLRCSGCRSRCSRPRSARGSSSVAFVTPGNVLRNPSPRR